MEPIKVKEEKKEDAGTSELDDHKHKFILKFGLKNNTECMVYCKKQGTVLQTIKSERPKEYERFIKKSGRKISDENIIIRWGKRNDCPIVATHFPCFCVDIKYFPCLCVNKCLCVEQVQYLTITTSAKVVEKQPEEARALVTGEYSVFFIDKDGGENTKSKKNLIFRCNRFPIQFRYFCVYGRKGMTVKEALRRDGRFVDDLTYFTLSDNETRATTNCTEIVDNLQGRIFQICLPKKGKTKATNPSQVDQEQDLTPQTSHEQQEENASASAKVQKMSKTATVLEHAKQKGISMKAATEELKIQIDLKEINDLLRKQFPKLKAVMESRFPGHSYNKALKLKKKNFGKIQNAFSEVYTVRELLNLSKSICLLMIEEKNNSGLTDLKKTVQGTGFVLFDRFVLTNAHLFESWEEIDLTITAEFDFEKEDKRGTKYQAAVVVCQSELVDGTKDSDFALLELTQIPGLAELDQGSLQETRIPPGPLKIFGRVPGGDGGACIIGHPAGGVKKMDITCVIQKEDREQAVKQNLVSCDTFTVCPINQIKRDIRVTYNTFMYHGSSGSPVFDAFGQVFGLHSGGFFYNEVIPDHSVIEFCYPLDSIFKKLLGELQKRDMGNLLERIMNEAKGNLCLDTILKSVGLKQTKKTGKESDNEQEMEH